MLDSSVRWTAAVRLALPGLALGLVLGLGVAARPAGAVTIDFEGLGGHGKVIGSVSGITVNVTNNGSGPDIAALFDTELASDPNDPDLLRQGTVGVDGVWDPGNLPGDTMFGKALIIQENPSGCATGTCNVPDDEAGGGVIELVLGQSILGVGLDVLDIDSNEGAGGVTFFDGMSSVFRSWTTLVGNNAGALGDNTANRIGVVSAASLGLGGIDKLQITFIASGAIDNLELDGFRQAPEPASTALLGMGLIGLAWVGRRRARG